MIKLTAKTQLIRPTNNHTIETLKFISSLPSFAHCLSLIYIIYIPIHHLTQLDI